MSGFRTISCGVDKKFKSCSVGFLEERERGITLGGGYSAIQCFHGNSSEFMGVKKVVLPFRVRVGG